MMVLLGIVCFAYYVWMGVLFKKWDFTFSWFWILLGVVCFILSIIGWKRYIFVLIACLFVFLAVELRIVLGMFSCREKNLLYLIVLGAQVRGTTMSGSLYRRIKRARVYLEENPETVVILSGGQGKGEEITEAEAMRRYLVQHGIKESRILMETESATTKENLEFSAKFVKDKSISVGIVTNNFHSYRAYCYAKQLGYGAPKSISAGCHPVFFVHYMVREFFAFCKMWLTKLKTVL